MLFSTQNVKFSTIGRHITHNLQSQQNRTAYFREKLFGLTPEILIYGYGSESSMYTGMTNESSDLHSVHKGIVLFVGMRDPVLERIIVNGSNIPSGHVYGRDWTC